MCFCSSESSDARGGKSRLSYFMGKAPQTPVHSVFAPKQANLLQTCSSKFSKNHHDRSGHLSPPVRLRKHHRYCAVKANISCRSGNRSDPPRPLLQPRGPENRHLPDPYGEIGRSLRGRAAAPGRFRSQSPCSRRLGGTAVLGHQRGPDP